MSLKKLWVDWAGDLRIAIKRACHVQRLEMDFHTKFQKNLKNNGPVIKFFIFFAGSFVGRVSLDGLL